MKNIKLSKLNQVELRSVWQHEALDFTQWLALDENLSLLSDELGLDITLIQTEAPVGRYNVDLLCEETNTGQKIIIENQLEITDHDHLGKLITYGSGQDAKYIIWVVKSAREEHRQALDWLNEHTTDELNFFLVKIELWQIGSSPYAPKFQVVSRPNEWGKSIKAASQNGSITVLKQLQYNFWNFFKDYASEKSTKLRLRKTNPQHWYDISCGIKNCHLSLTINSRTNELGCEVYIPDSKELYEKFLTQKDVIHESLGHTLDWMELPHKKACRIKLVTNGDILDETKWNDFCHWFLSQAETFASVFKKYS